VRLRAPAEFRFRREERGVVHSERRKNPLAQHLAERRSGDDLDDAPEHVGGVAVFPNLARLKAQRQRGERGDMLGHRPLLAHQIRREHLALHVRISGEAVGEAGRVPHQVLDRDRAFRRTSSNVSPVSTPTFTSANAGMYFASGSVTSSRPSSTSVIAATVTIGFVME